MKIERVINNSIVQARDDHNNEVILMGKGIGFSAKANNSIDLSQVHKTFVLNDTSNAYLQTLLNMPVEYIELAQEITEFASVQLRKKITDNSYIALVDHIETSIDRYREGIQLKNVLLWEVKQFYKDEYLVGLFALKIINERYHIEMLEDEAAFIAIHFVTSQLEESLPTVFKITTFINETIHFVEAYFDIVLDTDSSAFFRLTTHLKYFGQRLFGKMIVNDSNDKDLLKLIQTRYAKPYSCSLELKNIINSKYDYNLSDDECIYLTIHISKVLSDCSK